MHWLNVPVDILQRAEFSAAEPAEVGVWLRLAAYCAQQENGGVIRDCRLWTDRQWLVSAGVTAQDVKAQTRLWKWTVSGGLSVSNYPHQKEREVQIKRKAGKATANRRWANKSKGPNGSSSNSSATSSAGSSGDAEGEGEWNGMEE